MQEQATKTLFRKRDFWSTENLRYVKPHFRLEKSAQIVNRIAGVKKCDLLDVGCGPAALMHLLKKDIKYHGIDMAIHKPAPYLIEADFMEAPIAFEGKRFDIIVAQGVFEYAGSLQAKKFAEIKSLLKKDGTFLLSYVNFDHIRAERYDMYNNTQPFDNFKRDLEGIFRIQNIVPTSHHWHHREPNRRVAKKIHMHMNMRIPILSRMFAIEYFFICSVK
jgi:SAM-dependent methyltransferase